jgi:two-component system LytT family sensor kinase
MKSTDVNFIYDVLIRSNDNKLLYVSTSQFKLDGKNKATTDIEKKCFDKPGNYTVSITPRVGTMFSADIWKDTKNSVSFKFTVVTKEEKTFILKDLLNFGLIIGAVFGVTFVGALNYIKRKNIKKLKVEQQQKEISKMQLNNIRSQLNPHFMFNALAGIQNLMNKDKVDEANRYLNKFARLTRNVLDQKELTSLAEEKELLTDYLQMEQLRFGFTYEINITPDLDISNIEIPAMLLQPFLENAVKHGIAEKESEGKIEVDFSQLNQDLILTIKDNGRGFDVAKSYEGLGLQLSKSRIDLLNTIYQETPVTLELESDLNGTVITLTLTQWL